MPVNKASSTPSPRATYYSSAVDNVTHLCALLAELTAAPPKVITVPDTGRLPLDLSAQLASLYAVKSNPEPLTKVNPIPFVPLRYAMIFIIAFQCLSVGL